MATLESTLDSTLDSVHALAASQPRNGGARWFAARQSGLYRSDDAGKSWTDVYATLHLDAPLTTASIVLSPEFGSDNTLFAGALGGILRSTDGGTTWSVSELPAPPPFVVSLAVSSHYAEDGLVFAATLEDGVFRSWDRGASWAAWNFGLLDLNIYCLAASPDFAADDTLYVGTESGVFRSTNGGRAWRETAFPMDFGPVLSMVVLQDSSAKQTVYAATETNGVFGSDDGGVTWLGAGFQEAQTAVNQLLLARGRASEQTAGPLMAVTNSAVYLIPKGGGAWRELWARPADGDIAISAATRYRYDEEEMLLVGLSNGDVQAVPLLLDSGQSQ